MYLFEWIHIKCSDWLETVRLNYILAICIYVSPAQHMLINGAPKCTWKKLRQIEQSLSTYVIAKIKSLLIIFMISHSKQFLLLSLQLQRNCFFIKNNLNKKAQNAPSSSTLSLCVCLCEWSFDSGTWMCVYSESLIIINSYLRCFHYCHAKNGTSTWNGRDLFVWVFACWTK